MTGLPISKKQFSHILIILCIAVLLHTTLSALLYAQITNQIFSQSTWYVDDDNKDGPWDGTESRPFQNIQDAIDQAFENDQVFVYEGVYDENAKFTSFEFSARIVAGTNIYMDGSPYYSLLFNEPMSMGKRIAREVKTADSSGQLDKITT